MMYITTSVFPKCIYILSDLVPFTGYRVQVAAQNQVGVGPFSSDRENMTLPGGLCQEMIYIHQCYDVASFLDPAQLSVVCSTENVRGESGNEASYDVPL